jgi:hypothetical protein
MAKAAVITSMDATRCMGSAAIRSAPAGGAAILRTPDSVWFIPATRPSCSLGTIRVVDAFMDGPWKVPPRARTSMIPYRCQGCTRPRQYRNTSAAVKKAMVPSEMIITFRRLHRSTSAPATGPRITGGSRVMRVAVASTASEPVLSVSHQIRAKLTTSLPNRDRAWPDQIVKKRGCQECLGAVTRRSIPVIWPSRQPDPHAAEGRTRPRARRTGNPHWRGARRPPRMRTP